MVLAQSDEEIVQQFSGLTWVDWVTAAAILVVGFLVARTVGRLVTRTVGRTPASEFAGVILGRLVAGVLGTVAVVYALNAVDVSVGPLIGALGIAGLALAFAFQDILENVIAGLLMVLRRPITIGDEVMTNDYTGHVRDINLRSLEVVTLDGETVYIPNALVWKNPIVNFTAKEDRRSSLVVGVAYDTDLDRAKTVLERSIRGVEGVIEGRPVTAQVYEFGDSSVNFMMRYWHDPHTSAQWQLWDEVSRAVKRGLDAEGIEIPFPQRVLHMQRPEDAVG